VTVGNAKFSNAIKTVTSSLRHNL